MNPPLAILFAIVPLISRWNAIKKIVEEENIQGKYWHYCAGAAIKAIVNLAILAATYSIGMAFGPTACLLFLVSFCVSTFLNLGDASPIQHIEDFWSNSQDVVYPNNRTGV
jgi:hypothetical protein